MSYPKELPIAAIQEVISYLEKKPGVTLQSVIEDAYDVLGYLLYTFEGSSHPLIAMQMTDAEAVATLLPHGNVNIPWALLWTIIKGIIDQYLGSK